MPRADAMFTAGGAAEGQPNILNLRELEPLTVITCLETVVTEVKAGFGVSRHVNIEVLLTEVTPEGLHGRGYTSDASQASQPVTVVFPGLERSTTAQVQAEAAAQGLQ